MIKLSHIHMFFSRRFIGERGRMQSVRTLYLTTSLTRSIRIDGIHRFHSSFLLPWKAFCPSIAYILDINLMIFFSNGKRYALAMKNSPVNVAMALALALTWRKQKLWFRLTIANKSRMSFH